MRKNVVRVGSINRTVADDAVDISCEIKEVLNVGDYAHIMDVRGSTVFDITLVIKERIYMTTFGFWIFYGHITKDRTKQL
jgi:serine kinase of HPr protein (carbohydrate metabolism regulator)